MLYALFRECLATVILTTVTDITSTNLEGKNHQARHRRVRSHDWKKAQAHSAPCRKRIEERLGTTPHGAVRLDRRSEVINEALAEDVRREEQRKKRPAAILETTGSTVVSEPREEPIEQDTNPKRRLIMKSSSLTASGSGQQSKEKGSQPVMTSQECKLRRSGRWIPKKEQKRLRHRRRPCVEPVLMVSS